MTTAKIIDGKAIAHDISQGLKKRAAKTKAKLDVILIGHHAPSLIYVENKKKAAEEVGIECTIHHLSESTSENDVVNLIEKLNVETNGILLQLPVPPHLDTLRLLNAINPEIDVDGLNVLNVGQRTLNLPGILPCTPKGCLTLIKSVQQDLTGLHAVVVGRSDLVGKPMAQLLLRENCTVTQTHAHTKNLAELCRSADILVVAIGKPQFIKGDWIKRGAIVIDVGINRVDGKITGDVDFASAAKVAGAITPVPGGVGPMTIASLLENTLDAAENA